MKVGIIINFKDNALAIDVDVVTKSIKTSEVLKFCLIDNNSKDNTLNKLYEIKEECPEKIDIVEIKKTVSESIAQRAGLRFFNSHYPLKKIVFINASSGLNKKEFNEILKFIQLKLNNVRYCTERLDTSKTILKLQTKDIFEALKYNKQLHTKFA